MIEPTAIDHVCLSVSSLSQSKEYYERIFGAVCRPRDNDPKTLIVEMDHVHFFLAESAADRKFLSGQHLSFQVGSLDRVMSALKTLGISSYETGVVDFFKSRNYKWCEWRDPDGIRLECVEAINETKI